MATVILEKADKNLEYVQGTVSITEPVRVTMTGRGNATTNIRFNNALIATLDSYNPTFDITVLGDYTFRIAGQCNLIQLCTVPLSAQLVENVGDIPINNLYRVVGQPGAKVSWWTSNVLFPTQNARPYENLNSSFKWNAGTDVITHRNSPLPDLLNIDAFYNATTTSFATDQSEFLTGVGATGPSETSGVGQSLMESYIILENDAVIRDVNTNSPELGHVWIDENVTGQLLLLSARTLLGTDETDAVDSGLFNNVHLPAGIHRLVVATTSSGPHHGVNIEVSYDDGATYNQLLSSYIDKPYYESVPVLQDSNGDLVSAVDGSIQIVGPFDKFSPPKFNTAASDARLAQRALDSKNTVGIRTFTGVGPHVISTGPPGEFYITITSVSVGKSLTLDSGAWVNTISLASIPLISYHVTRENPLRGPIRNVDVTKLEILGDADAGPDVEISVAYELYEAI